MNIRGLLLCFCIGIKIFGTIGLSIEETESGSLNETTTKCTTKPLSSWRYKRYDEEVKVTDVGKVTSLELVQEHYRHAVICIKDQTFGFTASSVWVSHGCRATFRVCYNTSETFVEKMKAMVNEVNSCNAAAKQQSALVQAHQDSLSSMQNKLASKDIRVNALEHTVATHVNTNNAHSNNIKALERSITSKQTTLQSQSTALSKCRQEVSWKQKAMSKLGSDVRMKQNTISKCKQEVTSKQNALRAQANLLSTCKNDVNSKHRAILSKQAMLSTLERNLKSKQHEVNSHKNTISALERAALERAKLAKINEGMCFSPAHKTKYRGSVTTTKSGRTCQKWEKQWPHRHGAGDRTSDFVDGRFPGNACRCPLDDPEAAPWCYTTSWGTRWEYCHVPRC